MNPSHRPGKKSRKASTLTNTRKCPPQCRAIYERNLDAPFFRIPAELRNRIYEEVLANKTIHVDYYECPEYAQGQLDVSVLYRRKPGSWSGSAKLSHAICQANESEQDIYARSKSCSVEYGCSWPKIEEYDKRHKPCHKIIRLLEKAEWTDDGDGEFRIEDPLEYSERCRQLQKSHQHSRLDLSLLSVCRQIHKEAALIPYGSNTFAFTSGYVLDLFISGTLLAPQREAIKNIQAGNWLRGYDISVQSIRPSTVMSLANLVSFEAALEHPHGFRDNGIEHFMLLGLATARVYVQYRRFPDPEDDEGDGTSPQQCGEKCHKIRRVVDEIETLLKEDSGRRDAAKKVKAERKKARGSKKRVAERDRESEESTAPEQALSRRPRRRRLE